MVRGLKRVVVAMACAGVLGCSHPKPREAAGVIPPKTLSAMVKEDKARLGGVDSPLHKNETYLGVDTTGESGFYAFFHVLWGAPARMVHFFQGDTPLRTVSMMEDTKSPDNRRAGILKIVQSKFARKEPYTKRYSQIAQETTADPAVKAAAIRAMNYSRTRINTDVFVNGIDDEDAGVRLESAKALANVPVEKAVPKLVAHLQRDDSKDVRIASADALRNVKTQEAARALIGVLNDRDFGVAWQARQSLRLMTGHDFRYDDNAWVQYLAASKNPFI
jgi:hypothetical protein